MVYVCPPVYPAEKEALYSAHFDKYPFPLSAFQKFAIETIVEGNHILVTAHTGSGKSLPAEFAIEHFVAQGKKVIYTSPIKALSNQKFYEFSQKFPDISFGLLTGDIKTNPEADVLIMTTEILMNALYKLQSGNNSNNATSSINAFSIDFEHDLACVVFDEIHYINDADRGKVWEETILMLPHHIQMVMLSATLHSPETFANWCEARGNAGFKRVYLTSTAERVVPLTHYAFVTCTQGLFKVLKNKELEKEIRGVTNTLLPLQNAKNAFIDETSRRVEKTLQLFRDKNHTVKRQHVLNNAAKYLTENQMLPALFFVFSRKLLEQCAGEITTVLLEDDSKVPYIVRRECEQMIRQKLPNFEEYLRLPEYLQMVALLEKGIAIHHAGIMPILREMVELLFAKGYVKILFATETFAVGINMPTKTVVFTDIQKYDGTGLRLLHPHEYTQMAGRAGRRGIDTIGHVIHLTNLFRNIDFAEIKQMMKGEPQRLQSKFKISYNLVFNLIAMGCTNYTDFARQSMLQGEIEQQARGLQLALEKLNKELADVVEFNVPQETAELFLELKHTRLKSVNKQRREIDRQLQELQNTFPTIEKEAEMVARYLKKRAEQTALKRALAATESTMATDMNKVLQLLTTQGFLLFNTEKESYTLTKKGTIASQLREMHCLVFAELIDSGALANLEAKEVAAILSCFTSVTVPEELKELFELETKELRSTKELKETHGGYIECVHRIHARMQTYQELENQSQMDTGIHYDEMHFDLIPSILQWCECTNYTECNGVLQRVLDEKQVFLGEFVKSILKINAMAAELECVAEMLGEVELLLVLKQIPGLTLKHVVSCQSLYV